MAGSILGSGHTHSLSVLYVELRTMSWADQAIAIEFAVGEGSAVVSAHVFDAAHFVPQVDEYYEPLVDLKGLWCVWS